MKAFLLYRDRDLDLKAAPPPNARDLTQDLELDTLLRAMARDDAFLLDVARRVLLASLDDPEAIRYRQRVLADALAHPSISRELYALSGDALRAEREAHVYLGTRSPDLSLHGAVRVLELLLATLRRLRRIATEQSAAFHSEGFVRFFRMIIDELDEEYLRTVEEHLRRLRFERGVLMSARLGTGNRGAEYVLRKPARDERSWLERLLAKAPGYSFEIAPRDEAGAQALTALRAHGLNGVASAARQAADHVLSFFAMLRAETAFHVACLNLHDELERLGCATCTPVPLAPGLRSLSAKGLYDVTLSLRLGSRVVPNDVRADGKDLLLVTGANQGGKSTFLRSVGLAQLMLQSGMFVPATSFAANVCSGVFTHYRREEDATMESGKLDEELRRMSDLADRIRPGALLLCNESFSSTNEQEGSEIARQVLRALRESGVKVVFVTHLYDLAESLRREASDELLLLRAERLSEGRRTFRIVEGDPLPTSYGPDLYREVFGTTDAEQRSA